MGLPALPPQPEAWSSPYSALTLWTSGGELSPPPWASLSPWALWEGGWASGLYAHSLNPASGPTEGSWWQEGPVPLPVHRPHSLHHPEAKVRLPATQLHEPVSGWEWGCLVQAGEALVLPWALLPYPGQSTPLAPHRYTAASVIDTASKYKMLWKLPLEDADIIKGGAGSGLPGGPGVGVFL